MFDVGQGSQKEMSWFWASPASTVQNNQFTFLNFFGVCV